MRIGAHVSIAGGIINAPKNAADLGCEVFQMFTRSPQGGPAPKITPEIIKTFKKEMEGRRQQNCYIHTPYYINLASADKKIRNSSARIIREELDRGDLIEAKYVMTHLGSYKDSTLNEALKMAADGIRGALDDYDGKTELLLEISAGAGSIIGDTFEELAGIFQYLNISKFKNAGVCLDSAHMFASGYDIKTAAGFEETVSIIKRTVGFEKIRLIHANDSKVGLGEKKDRHDHIGNGKIGVEGFENLIKAFPGIDFILETKHDKVAEDIKILREIRNKNE